MKKKLATNVSQFYIAKAFWKTFMYKLEYNFDDPSRSSKGSLYWDSTWQNRADHASRRRSLWNLVQGFSRAVKRFAKEHNIKVKTRAENGSVSVFVEREADALLMLNKYKTNLSAVWVPYNTTQVEMLQGDLQATLAFRKTLFGASSSSNGYRYKVQCSVSDEVKKSYDAISAFCSNLNSKDFKANENWNKIGKGAKMSYWNTFSMYFNEEQDIMMLKLILGGSDIKILKAVLYSEIDDKVLE